MFTYDHFEVGKTYGTDDFAVSRDRIDKWLAVYPNDDNGPLMPPGMTAMIQIQCYMACITPRPKGNVHGSQVFRMTRLPRIGETLTTEVCCTGKEVRKGRKWVETTYTTRDEGGATVFTGVMTTLVAA